MKGMHWTIILAIIIFIVLLVIMFGVFILPIQAQGSGYFNQTEFRMDCAWWAQKDYQDTYAILSDGTKQDMTTPCKQALNLPIATNMADSDWNNCRNTCRVAYTKV